MQTVARKKQALSASKNTASKLSALGFKVKN
jgi:hypothetical protein